MPLDPNSQISSIPVTVAINSIPGTSSTSVNETTSPMSTSKSIPTNTNQPISDLSICHVYTSAKKSWHVTITSDIEISNIDSQNRLCEY